MGLLLQGTGVRLGLVTNGERWVLVNAAAGETVGYASWYASLARSRKPALRKSVPRLASA